MSNDEIATLIAQFKRRLKITWNNSDDTENLADNIKTGIEWLNSRACGYDVDYIADYQANELLYDIVRYIRSDCFENFETAFKSQIVAFGLKYRAKINAESEAANETEVTD